MINIVFFKDKKGNILRYTIKGHANYDEEGKDIICSAVSVLGQTALMSFVSVGNISENDIDYKISDGNLDVKITYEKEDKNNYDIQIIMKTLEVGIKSIIENYPGYVTLKYREV